MVNKLNVPETSSVLSAMCLMRSSFPKHSIVSFLLHQLVTVIGFTMSPSCEQLQKYKPAESCIAEFKITSNLVTTITHMDIQWKHTEHFPPASQTLEPPPTTQPIFRMTAIISLVVLATGLHHYPGGHPEWLDTNQIIRLCMSIAGF